MHTPTGPAPTALPPTVDWRRVAIFYALAVAISGAAAAALAATGGLQQENFTWVIAGLLWYMAGPALAHLLTRLLTREGWQDLGLRPRLRHGWSAWVIAWVLPGLLVILGSAIYFAIFPQHYDAGLTTVRGLLDQAAAQAGQPIPLSPELYALLQIAQAMLIAPLVNGLATLGEEFGWRPYLQRKLMPLGWRRAMLWMGLLWGVWHWPILALGHNYGLDYPGAPWLGMLAFLWFTFTVGTILGWLTLRGESVWPAVIGHAALNGIAGLPLLFTVGNPHPVLGPTAVGLLGGLSFALVALWLWLRPPTQP